MTQLETLEIQFNEFHTQQKLNKAIKLKTADGRLGNLIAIVREGETGSISILVGYMSYPSLATWMEGYAFAKEKSL